MNNPQNKNSLCEHDFTVGKGRSVLLIRLLLPLPLLMFLLKAALAVAGALAIVVVGIVSLSTTPPLHDFGQFNAHKLFMR